MRSLGLGRADSRWTMSLADLPGHSLGHHLAARTLPPARLTELLLQEEAFSVRDGAAQALRNAKAEGRLADPEKIVATTA